MYNTIVTQPEASIVDECASVSFAVDRSKEDSIESEVGQQSSQYEDTFVGTDVEGTKDSVAYDNTFADETNQTHDTVAYDDTFAKLSTAYEDTFIEGDEENVDKTKSFVDDEGDDGYADTFMEDSKTEMPSYENTFVEAEDTDEPVLAQAPAKEPVKVNKDKTELADRVTAMVFEDLMVGLLGDVVTVAGTQQARAGALDDRATVTSAFPQQQGESFWNSVFDSLNFDCSSKIVPWRSKSERTKEGRWSCRESSRRSVWSKRSFEPSRIGGAKQASWFKTSATSCFWISHKTP